MNSPYVTNIEDLWRIGDLNLEELCPVENAAEVKSLVDQIRTGHRQCAELCRLMPSKAEFFAHQHTEAATRMSQSIVSLFPPKKVGRCIECRLLFINEQPWHDYCFACWADHEEEK